MQKMIEGPAIILNNDAGTEKCSVPIYCSDKYVADTKQAEFLNAA